jgi:hypothetical protein
MTERQNINGYSFSWTQPYLPTSYNPFYERKVDIAEEMIRIDAVDNIVQNMLTYPDAELILKKLKDDNF